MQKSPTLDPDKLQYPLKYYCDYQHKSDEGKIHFYKRGTKTITYQTGAPSYVWPYDILIWIDTYKYLSEHSH